MPLIKDSGMVHLAKSAANGLVAVVIFLMMVLMISLTWEYFYLTSSEGDAGYPFGWEAGGPAYATKADYLEHSRRLIAIMSVLLAVMVFGLVRSRPAFAWAGCLITVLLLFVQWAQSVA